MRKNFPLKELNSWKAGGICREFAVPSNIAEARALLSQRLKNREPLYILGGGSNVLIQDGFLDALVFSTGRLEQFTATEKSDGVVLEIEAGYPIKKLLKFAIKNHLGGFEFLVGIPGTLGGALRGNAGAAGAGFSGLISSAEAIEADGGARVWSASELNWQYRSSPFAARNIVLITKAWLLASPAEPKEIIDKIRFFANLKKGQPLGRKTAGCVFKNPGSFSAGKLIDTAGCKGMRVGGAIVSNSHANFIENQKNATARDIYELCEKCRERVLKLHRIRLEYEINFFGAF